MSSVPRTILILGCLLMSAVTAKWETAARAQCYPGLGNCVPGGGGATKEEFYFVGPVKPPDPWLALRTEPSSTAGSRIMEMPQGTPFRLLATRGPWYRVQLLNGTVGWAHSSWIRCCKTVN